MGDEAVSSDVDDDAAAAGAEKALAKIDPRSQTETADVDARLARALSLAARFRSVTVWDHKAEMDDGWEA